MRVATHDEIGNSNWASLVGNCACKVVVLTTIPESHLTGDKKLNYSQPGLQDGKRDVGRKQYGTCSLHRWVRSTMFSVGLHRLLREARLYHIGRARLLC